MYCQRVSAHSRDVVGASGSRAGDGEMDASQGSLLPLSRRRGSGEVGDHPADSGWCGPCIRTQHG